MRIGIVTFHNVYNYGGMLQAFALCHYLQARYGSCTVIDYQQAALSQKYSHRLWDNNKSLKQNAKHFVAYYLLRRNYTKEKKFNSFMQEHMPLTRPVKNLLEFKLVAQEFDLLLSGSDQLWNPQFTGGKLDPVYFLNTGAAQRKFAYASSAGARIFEAQELEQLKDYLSSYEAVAVREDFLQQQLLPLRADVAVVLDPTLLLNKAAWQALSRPFESLPLRFVLLYTFDNDAQTLATAARIAAELKLPIVSLFKVKTNHHIAVTCADLGPQEFLHLMDRCSFVVTNSFHGTAFALNFQKDFFSIYKTSNPHRVMNLLGLLGLENRVLKQVEDLPETGLWAMDFTAPSEALEALRRKAYQFLNFNLW